jgi:hypothetical protein
MRERFPMKRSWGWILAAIAVVSLLCSLTLEAGRKPASRFEKHAFAWSGESRSPSCSQSLRVLSRCLLRSRARPQEVFLIPDVSLRAADLDPGGPPWLEFRGPPDRYRDLGRPCRAVSRETRDGSRIEGENYASAPNFPAAGRPNLKSEVLQHSLDKLSTQFRKYTNV